MLACRSPSGHGANGRSVARRSSDWAGRAGAGAARSVATSTGAASGPASEAPALQAGSALPPCWATPIAVRSVSGAAVSTRASPLNRRRSHASVRWSIRCSAPAFASRCTRASRSRTGCAPSALACSSPMCSERSSSSIGSRRLVGGVRGALVLGVAKARSTRRAATESMATRNHSGAGARVIARPRQPTPVSVRVMLPPGRRTTRRCA